MDKVGFIGSRNHAARVRALVIELGTVKDYVVYHPTDSEIENGTNEFQDLLSCDAIFVLSPNHTHVEFLRQLATPYQGYIFCEKPPTNNIDALEWLANSFPDPTRLYFNFQLRKSHLREALWRFVNSEDLGIPLYCTVQSSHGLAFKPEYKQNWRSKNGTHPLGIIETKGIHYLDLLFDVFGMPSSAEIQLQNVAASGSAIDTTKINLGFESELTADLFFSYATPYTFVFRLIATNGILEANHKEIIVYSPRDCFDSKGLFITPPVTDSFSLRQDNGLNAAALESSVSYFLTACEKKEPIPKEEFEKSIATNRFVLESQRYMLEQD